MDIRIRNIALTRFFSTPTEKTNEKARDTQENRKIEIGNGKSSQNISIYNCALRLKGTQRQMQ